MAFYSRLRRITQQTLEEAKAECYTFKIYRGDEERIVHADDVQISEAGITYPFNRAEINLPYSAFYIQVLPGGKTVSLIEKISPMWQLWGVLPALAGASLVGSSGFLAGRLPVSKDAIEGFAVAVILASYATMFLSIFYIRNLYSQREIRAATSSGRLITQLEKASDVEDYFSRLIQVNLQNMEQYYLLVRIQTEKSYRLTQVISVVGFMILISGIILGFFKGIESAPTAITLISGALVEFISTIFFYVYNKTVLQLNTYHEKLVNVQDTMLALKVAQVVKNEELKDQTMAYLTKALTRRLYEKEEADEALPATQKKQAPNTAAPADQQAPLSGR